MPMRVTLNQFTPEMRALLEQPVLARLATAHPGSGQPHVVPVWFGWDGTGLWISAFASTRKVKDLRLNQRCAIIIEPVIPDAQPQAILFEGQAELITEPRRLVTEKSLWIYQRYLGEAGAQAEGPQSWSQDPENTLIHLVAEDIFVW